MRSPMQRSLEQALEEICQAIQYTFAAGERCFIPFSIYNHWPEEILKALEKSEIIRKEPSQKLKTMRCGCNSVELWRIEGCKEEGFFIQCFECGNVSAVPERQREYYESSAIQIANFLTTQINDLDCPKKIEEDVLFFVGERSEDIFTFLSVFTPDSRIKALCSSYASSQPLIIISIAKLPLLERDGTILSFTGKGLVVLRSDENLSLELTSAVQCLLKSSTRQMAANTRWKKDAKNKAKETLRTYIAPILSEYSLLNHLEIAEKIEASDSASTLLKYQDGKGASKKFSLREIREIVATLLKGRGEAYRISGNREYRDDRHSWYTVNSDGSD